MANPLKRCPRCGVEKSRATDFGKKAGWCKSCANEYMKAKYHGNTSYRERVKAYHRVNERKKRRNREWNAERLSRLRERYRDDPEWREKKRAQARASRLLRMGRHLAHEARKRAARKGIPFLITPEWMQSVWESDPRCTYCRCELYSAQGKMANDSATLDRAVPELGYTVENTLLSCFRCNTLKRDSTVDELERLVANWRRVLGK